jgi:hypothetical protein
MDEPTSVASREAKAAFDHLTSIAAPDLGSGPAEFEMAGYAGSLSDSMVAGPFLTGVVMAGFYGDPIGGGPGVQPASADVGAPGHESGRSRSHSERAMSQSPESISSKLADPAHTGAAASTVRREDGRRGSDRCVLLLPHGGVPSKQLMASLQRRNVEVLVCLEPHDAVARVCALSREATLAERQMVRQRVGGLALIICEPEQHAELAELAELMRQYCPRCVCWQFKAASGLRGDELKPLELPEIEAEGALEAAGEVGNKAGGESPNAGGGGADGASAGRAGADERTMKLVGAADPAAPDRGVAEREDSSGSALRLSNWVRQPADNQQWLPSEIQKVNTLTQNQVLSPQELAMLLAEIPDAPAGEAASPRPGASVSASGRHPGKQTGFRP